MRARAAIAVAVALGCGPAGCAPEPHGAVLLVLDTLRADHLSAYGHSRETSPALDALADRGVLFEQAISNSSWTLPAAIALLSASYPTAAIFEHELKRSLVEVLRDAGIQTAGLTEGAYLSRHFGFDRGFEHYEEEEGAVQLLSRARPRRRGAQGGIERTFARAHAWLREHGEQRFFLLVHTYEVHTPYRRSSFAQAVDPGALGASFEIPDVMRVRHGEIAVGATEINYLSHLYDGGVAVADRHVGELLETLEELELADRTLVVVTSDHGEEFGERFPRWAGDHGHSLYDEQVRIPLIVYDPLEKPSASRIAAQVRIIDVMPTIVDFFELPAVEGVGGQSLLPLLRGRASEDREALLRLFTRSKSPMNPSRAGIRYGGHKLLINLPFVEPARPSVELYDLRADPGERVNLADERPELREAMRARLRAATTALKAAGDPVLHANEELPGALRRRLRALGYAQ